MNAKIASAVECLKDVTVHDGRLTPVGYVGITALCAAVALGLLRIVRSVKDKNHVA